MTKHVAVVGAGLGGLRAAEQLRAAGHSGPVTVIGAEPHLPYSRPPLSKDLLGHDLHGCDDLAALHARVAFRRRASVADVTFRLGVPVTAVDVGPGSTRSGAAAPGGELTLADGNTVRFDGLVVASGLRPRRLNVPGPSGPGSGRHVVRTLDDCAALRADLRAALSSAASFSSASFSAASASAGSASAGSAARPAAAVRGPAAGGRPRVVVIGGGFVGCEVACTALAAGCAVTVVEPAGTPLLRVLGAELAQAVQRAHERAGIAFITGRAVIGCTGGDRVTGVLLADGADADGARVTGGPASGGRALAGTVLPASVVVEAVGSVPNTEWLAGAGLDTGDGVLCDNTLAAVTTAARPFPVPPVVAVGDVARFPNPLFDDVPRRVEHWAMPGDTARRAALTLRALLDGDRVDTRPFWPLPSFWSDQGGLRLQSYGSPGLADDAVIAEGDPGDPAAGLLTTYRRGGRLAGLVAVNLPPAKYRALRAALLDQ
jgi:3-phenylpropionate/trans-cinnamate dioxygenase ferredoxin reductase subunit